MNIHASLLQKQNICKYKIVNKICVLSYNIKELERFWRCIISLICSLFINIYCVCNIIFVFSKWQYGGEGASLSWLQW